MKHIFCYFTLVFLLFSCGSTEKEHLPEGKRVIVIGSIDKNENYQNLMRNIPKFEECYSKNIISNGKLNDVMLKLQFTIGPLGNVTRASATNKDNNLPARTKDCVVTHLKTIQFPQPDGGAGITINIPLKLQAKQR